MGRGRAKAKQTKVARALKYHSPDTDLAALQRELGGRAAASDPDSDQYEEYVDEADEGDDEDDDADDGTWATRHA
ncbi:MAG TPA: DUF3073 domain-containing protein [Micromonosporaceae bacterium]|jgi:hypothetical protein